MIRALGLRPEVLVLGNTCTDLKKKREASCISGDYTLICYLVCYSFFFSNLPYWPLDRDVHVSLSKFAAGLFSVPLLAWHTGRVRSTILLMETGL
jgi:hypothetical protein